VPEARTNSNARRPAEEVARGGRSSRTQRRRSPGAGVSRGGNTRRRLGLGRGVLGDGLGALRHGVLGQLSGEEQAHRGLHLAGGQGGLLVVADQAGGLAGDALEDVVDEGVHDGTA